MPLFRRNVCNRGSPQSRRLTPLAVFLSAFFLAASANAATYYVSTTGSDSGDGSQAHPWKTIAHATATMKSGDTAYVAGGVYKEQTIWMQTSGISLLAAPGEKPVIDFSSASGDLRRIMIQSAAGAKTPIGNITIDGFEIKNGVVGIDLFNAYNVTIRHNWIHDNTAQGILGNGKNVLVDSNSISHNGDFSGCASGGLDWSGNSSVCNKDHGMYVSGTNWTITNNTIYDNLAGGIQLAGYPYENGAHGAADPSYAGASGFLIANNTFAYQENGPGIYMWQAGNTNNKIINNIFYEDGQKNPSGAPQGISFYNSGGGQVVQNNLFYASGAGATAAMGGTAGWQSDIASQSGNINANPNFVNAPATLAGGSLDFHLQPGSPAIDAGLAIPGMASNDPTPDIGASDTSGFTHPVTGTSGGAGGTGGGGSSSGGLSNCAR